MSSTKVVLFKIDQTPPQYKTICGGQTFLKTGLIALHSETFVDILSLKKKCFVRDANAFIISSSVSGAINRLVQHTMYFPMSFLSYCEISKSFLKILISNSFFCLRRFIPDPSCCLVAFPICSVCFLLYWMYLLIGICSFVWNDPAALVSGSKSYDNSLALSHITGNLSIYQLQTTQSICTTELHRLTLKSLLKEHCRIGKNVHLAFCQFSSCSLVI